MRILVSIDNDGHFMAASIEDKEACERILNDEANEGLIENIETDEDIDKEEYFESYLQQFVCRGSLEIIEL